MAKKLYLSAAAHQYDNPTECPVHCGGMVTTTYKTLRGPRGGLILTNDEEIAKKIDKAIFLGIRVASPLMPRRGVPLWTPCATSIPCLSNW